MALTPTNRLLTLAQPQDLKRLQAHLQPVELAARRVLYGPSKPLDCVYFPLTGMISLVKPLEDGSAIEVGIVGNEGFVGVPLLLHSASMAIEVMVQAPTTALRMSAEQFMKETSRSVPLQKVLLRYAQALHVQVTQTAACNGRHTLHERLARWLLEAHDRIDSRELELSHELVAMMLGVRRSGVTVLMGAYKKAGIIDSKRGHIVVRDRKALEKNACECYRAAKVEFDRLLSKAD